MGVAVGAGVGVGVGVGSGLACACETVRQANRTMRMISLRKIDIIELEKFFEDGIFGFIVVLSFK